MLPIWLKIKIPQKSGESFTLWLPLFIVWLLLFPVALLLTPFILLASLLTWRAGYGRLILLLFPMIISLLWNMHGLRIDVQDKKERIYLSFI